MLHGPVPGEAGWNELRCFLDAVLRASLSRDDSFMGWESAEGIVGLAEPICAALNLYHFIILREGVQGTNWTGECPTKY